MNNRLKPIDHVHVQEMLAYDEVQISRVPDPKIILRRMVPYNLEQTKPPLL